MSQPLSLSYASTASRARLFLSSLLLSAALGGFIALSDTGGAAAPIVMPVELPQPAVHQDCPKPDQLV